MNLINFPSNLSAKATYVVCGLDSTVVDNKFSYSIQPTTGLFMKVSFSLDSPNLNVFIYFDKPLPRK